MCLVYAIMVLPISHVLIHFDCAVVLNKKSDLMQDQLYMARTQQQTKTLKFVFFLLSQVYFALQI